jgi:hypothetical protein
VKKPPLTPEERSAVNRENARRRWEAVRREREQSAGPGRLYRCHCCGETLSRPSETYTFCPNAKLRK